MLFCLDLKLTGCYGSFICRSVYSHASAYACSVPLGYSSQVDDTPELKLAIGFFTQVDNMGKQIIFVRKFCHLITWCISYVSDVHHLLCFCCLQKWCAWLKLSGVHGGSSVVSMVEARWCPWWKFSGVHGRGSVVSMVESCRCPWWKLNGVHGGILVVSMVEAWWCPWWEFDGVHGGMLVVSMVEAQWCPWWKLGDVHGRILVVSVVEAWWCP